MPPNGKQTTEGITSFCNLMWNPKTIRCYSAYCVRCMGEFERQVTDLLCCEEAHTKRIGRENEIKNNANEIDHFYLLNYYTFLVAQKKDRSAPFDRMRVQRSLLMPMSYIKSCLYCEARSKEPMVSSV